LSLGLAVFASVVLILAVYHRGFRKVLLWTSLVIVVLAGLALAAYFGYDRYTTWKADRALKKQQAETEKGVQDCIARLGALPGMDMLDKVYAETACRAYPDNVAQRDEMMRANGFFPDLPSGYAIEATTGKIVPLPPPVSIKIDPPTGPPPGNPFAQRQKKKTPVGLEASISCDVIVYDRDKFDFGDPQAIGTLHKGDTVRYIGHVTVGGEDIIQFRGRRGYVDGCVDVKQ
jgi:hypothetical protein